MDILNKYNVNLTIKDRNGNEHSIVPEDTITKVEEVYNELKQLMVSTDTSNMSDEEKDMLYAKAQEIWKKGADKGGAVNVLPYNLLLYRSEYTYLTDLILNKLEYDIDALFFIMEIRKRMAELQEKATYKDDNTLIAFTFTPIELHYLVKILNTHKVKGLKKEAFNMYNIFTTIGSVTRIYDTLKHEFTELSKEMLTWVSKFTEPTTTEEIK